MLDVILPALFLGLAGSLHCLGMCGPLLLLSEDGGRRSELGYHLGRLLSYGTVGLFLGWSAARLDLFVGSQVSQLLGGGFMVLVGLASFGAFQRLGLALPRLRRLGELLMAPLAPLTRSASWESRGALGLLTGFFPCGLLWAAYAQAAASGEPLAGALTMLSFGIASAPALGLLPALYRRFDLRRKTLRRLAGLSVVVLGLLIASGPLLKEPEAAPACPLCPSPNAAPAPRSPAVKSTPANSSARR